MNKLSITSLIVSILTLALVGFSFFGHSGGNLVGQTTCNNGKCTDYDAVNVSAGYYINDVLAFSSSVATFGFLTQGGGVTATSSTGAGTLTTANITVGLLEHTNAGATTITLPASTTITSLIPTAGQSYRMTYVNLGTGIDTIAGGTGTLLHVASSTIATGLKTVAPSGSALFIFTRKSNTDIVVDMIPAQ